jgi:DNA-binding CsgD family transcriptional regulator
MPGCTVEPVSDPRMDSAKFASAVSGMTAAERRVLQSLAHGRSNVEVADALGCSRKTVENHLVALTRKFEPRARREELIRWSWEFRDV